MSGGKSGTKLCSFKNLIQIGRGGFGVVYSAQRENGEKVAIKKIGKEASLNRIKEEIKTMKLLDHRNIVKFYEAFSENADTYLVMELCEGGSLMDYVKQKGPLDDSTAVHILRQLIAAVKYIHREKFLHRDLSAGNVFIKDATKSKITVKLGDFGLATNLGFGETACTIVGTPGFIAPQVFRQNYDQSADVYSLGAVLYTMLTKHTPPTKGAPNTESLARRNRSAADLVEQMMLPDAKNRIKLKDIVMTEYMKENTDEDVRIYSREVSRESRHRSREPIRSSREVISSERRQIVRSTSQPANYRRALDCRSAQDRVQTISTHARNSREHDRGRERDRRSERGLNPNHETETRPHTWPIRMERLAGQRLRTAGGRYIVETDNQCRFEVASKGDIVRRILVVKCDPNQHIQTVHVHRITDRQEKVRELHDTLIELTKSSFSYTSLSDLPNDVFNDYNRLQNMVVCYMASRVAKITFRRPPQFPDASAQLMENGDLRIRCPRCVVVRKKDNGEIYNCVNGENNREKMYGSKLSKVEEVYTYLARFEMCLNGMGSKITFPITFSVGSDIVGNSNNSPQSILPSTSSQPSRFPLSSVSSNQQSLAPHSAPLLTKPVFSRPSSLLSDRRATSTDENTAPIPPRNKYKLKLNPVTREVVSVQAQDGRCLRCSTSVKHQFIFTDPLSINKTDSRPEDQRFMQNGRVPERASEMLQTLLDRINKR